DVLYAHGHVVRARNHLPSPRPASRARIGCTLPDNPVNHHSGNKQPEQGSSAASIDAGKSAAAARPSPRPLTGGVQRRGRGYYVWKIAVTAVALAAGWAAFVLVGDSWWQGSPLVPFSGMV
ncbi:MAG: hypothetical protein ACM3ML_31760, partial [Micromonosporaceae bacterium]